MGSGNNDDGKNTLFAQGIIARIIATQQRNERWFSLTMHQLGISEPVLRGYLNHRNGDSLPLATLIHFTRRFIRNVFLPSWYGVPHSDWQGFPLPPIFWMLRPIHAQDTLPELPSAT
jgi:hypothetical protein